MTDHSSMKLLLDHYVSSQRCHIKTHPWFHCCITLWLTRQWTTVTSLPASLSFIITTVVTTTTIFRISSTYYYGRRQIIKEKNLSHLTISADWNLLNVSFGLRFLLYQDLLCHHWPRLLKRVRVSHHFLYTPLLLLVVKINPKARIPGGPWRVDPFFIVWLLEIWNWVFGQRRILEVMKVKTQIEVKWRN